MSVIEMAAYARKASMMHTRTSLAIALALMVIDGAAACSAAPIHDGEAVNIAPDCIKTVKGQSLFIGRDACLAALPITSLKGYWIIDHEYSVFYSDYENAPAYDTSAYWAEISSEIAKGMRRIYHGKRVVYYIEFEGTISDRPGIYGNGEFNKAIFIKNIKLINVKS